MDLLREFSWFFVEFFLFSACFFPFENGPKLPKLSAPLQCDSRQCSCDLPLVPRHLPRGNLKCDTVFKELRFGKGNERRRYNGPDLFTELHVLWASLPKASFAECFALIPWENVSLRCFLLRCISFPEKRTFLSSERAKGAAKASCGETVVQKDVFGESVSSLPP